MPKFQLPDCRYIILVITIFALSFNAKAQTETLSTGSFIINMGATNPNTIANGLKPYGMIYDLMKNNNVPIKWIISPTKLKDGEDFNYNGVSYKGGTFIIPAEQRNAAVNAKISSWQGQGVAGITTTSPLTLNVTRTLTAVPRWTLDATNGAIAQGYLTNAGVPTTAYNWKAVSALDCCDDFYVMPHADPTWATHNRLFSWNKDCLGSIWAACHAVSALENSINPANATQQMNFLSTRTAVIAPTPWPNNSLKLWGTHAGGSVAYTHQLPGDQVAQYMGSTDLAQLNGSEQIYIPKQVADGAATRWNPGATIIAYDPTQANVPAPDLANGNVAAVMVYGRGKDDPTRGYVMYEAGHSHNKGTAGDVAAQRAFLNFSFFQVQPKAPQLTITGITGGQIIPGNTTITGLNVGASSPLTGITFTYQWSSNCGGAFSNPSGTTTNFTAPVVGSTINCILSCAVTDNCGRTSFQSFPVTILAATPPSVTNDAQSIDPGCGSAIVTKNILTNDVEPDGQPMTLTLINGNSGSFTTTNGGLVSFTANGNVTYVSALGFVGTDILTYTVCDNTSPTPLCSNGTYTLTIGNIANVPNAVNDAVTIAEDAILANYNVLANDLPLVSGPITVSGIAVPPANGKVSINTDNTITYVPNADFAGTDVITYRIVNSLGYSKTATLTVTVTNDDCDGGTYQSAAGSSGTVTYNTSIADMAMYYQAPVNLINNGIRPTLEVTGNTAEQPRRALLHFDLSTLPGGITITNADLRLRRSGGNNNSQTIDIYRMITAWNEGTLNNNPNTLVSNGATWYGPNFSTKWNTIGGDFTTTNGASLTGLTATNTVYTWNVSTITQGWYNSTFPNYGFIVKDPTEANNNDKIFDSRENTTLANRPTLRITYNPGNVTVDIIAGRDNWIYESTVQKIFEGNTTTFQTNADGPNNNEARLLLKFDVKPADIPTGSTVTSATMKLTRTGGDTDVQDIGVYQATNSWNEGPDDNTINTATLNGATWFNRNFTQLWNTNGGDFTLTGGAVTSVSTATGGTAGTANYNWNVLSIVQNWVKTSPDPNHGFVIKAFAENENVQKVFGTKENITTANRPTLIVNYTSPAVCGAIPARAPLALPDTATTNSSTTVIIPVTTNDALFGQAVTSVTISTAPSNGSATVIGNTIQYTPSGALNGVATLQYTVTTANGNDVVNVYINVTGTPVNAFDDAPAGALSGTVQTINVKANDIDPEGTATSTVTIATAPKNGTATVDGSGAVLYTPNTGFTGNDTLFYSICEPAPTCGVAYCDTARVVIVVQNRAPVANNDTKTATPCLPNTFNLISNDTDAENNNLTVNVVSITPVDLSTVVANTDGTISFTPQAGAAPTYTVTYNVTDNGVIPQVSNNATVTITVPGFANNAPIAVDDYGDTTGMDEILYFNVKDNDSDPDGHTLSSPTITINPLHGTAIVLASGAIQYIPNPGFAGADTLTYQVCDQPTNPATCAPLAPLCSNTVKLFIFIKAPNTVVATNDENSTWINTPVTGGVIGNDFDPEGDTKIFTGFIDGSFSVTSGSITVNGVDTSGSPVANAGTLTINANGTYTFTPANNFAGTVSVPYTISDNQSNKAVDTALLVIKVAPYASMNNSVIANNDEKSTLMNTALSSTLFANDSDPQSNTYSVTTFKYDSDGDGVAESTGAVGTATIVAGITTTGVPVANAGSLNINADGTYTFTPTNDFTGVIESNYTITDQFGAASSAILRINILPDLNGALNNPPLPADDFAYTNANTPVTSSFVSNDNDLNGNPVSVNGTTIVTGGAHTLIAGSSVTTAQGGTIQFYADGTYTYTPLAGYTGPDSAGYQICDVTAVNPQPLCTNAFIHILVGAGNTTYAVNNENSTWNDINVSGDILTNDFDLDNHTQTFGSFLHQSTGLPIATGATVSGTDKTGAAIANAGLLTFATNGTYTFDPDPDFTGIVTVSYDVCDNGNTPKCDTAYLTITVDSLPNTGANMVIANNDENISYSAPVSNNLFVNDRDPQNNTFTVTTITGGTPGTAFTVAGKDQNGNTVSNAGTLLVNADGTYTYTPTSGFTGSINVPYIITDALGATSTAVLHIEVITDPNGTQNNTPFAADDFGYTTINIPVDGNFISNDRDPNGNPVSLNGTTIVPGGAHTAIGSPVATVMGGNVQFYADGTSTYTPPAGYVGPDKVNYSICDVTAIDPQPLCADAQIHLLVGPGISIGGKVWDDANGNVIDEGITEPETNAGSTLYVNLVGGLGNVVATTPVAADGSYNFSNVKPGVTYTLQLTTNQGAVGNPAPAVALPVGWTNTGETRNGSTDAGTLGVIDTRNYGFTNTVNFDFGIEQLPNTDDYTSNIPQPIVGTTVTLNGGTNPPALGGMDPEDCNAGCTMAGKSVIIDAVPANSELYYNGVLVTNGQSISNFDPALLEIRMTAATIGSASTSFQYSYVDLAGKKDPTPATYTLIWSFPLPVILTSFTGIPNKCDAVLQWKTAQEINTEKFVIEQSGNGLNFNPQADVKAANSATGKSYQITITQPSGIMYYRLKMVDKDGNFSYSSIITLRTSCNNSAYVSVYPNPVTTNITVSFYTEFKGQVNLVIANTVGQHLTSKKIMLTSSANSLNLDMTHYFPGIYTLYLIDDKGIKVGEAQKVIKK